MTNLKCPKGHDLDEEAISIQIGYSQVYKVYKGSHCGECQRPYFERDCIKLRCGETMLKQPDEPYFCGNCSKCTLECPNCKKKLLSINEKHDCIKELPKNIGQAPCQHVCCRINDSPGCILPKIEAEQSFEKILRKNKKITALTIGEAEELLKCFRCGGNCIDKVIEAFEKTSLIPIELFRHNIIEKLKELKDK